MKRKLVSLLLACLMLVSCVSLAACGENTDENPDTVVSDQNTEEAATLDGYAAMEKTKFDRSFVILTTGDVGNDFYTESYGAEGNSILNDGIYERNAVIKDDFGVTVSIFDGGDVETAVKKQVSSGLDEYDTLTGNKFTFLGSAQSNCLMNMNDVTSLDLSGPWWDAACRDNLTAFGKTLLMTGDILPVSSLLTSSCFTFNKELMKELGKQEPYEAVKAGKWTLELFNELSADVTTDRNGDGKLVDKDDIFGMSCWMMDVAYSMYYGADGVFATIDEDGAPVLSFNQEKMVNIYEKIYQGLVTQKANYITNAEYVMSTYDTFTAGRALFCDLMLCKITYFLLGMEQDYGILPVPKFDEYQKEYLSFVNGASALIGIITTEQDPEFVGTILEAMSAYNYVHITPNMYEIVTKLKAARDPQSSEMVDYIIRNRIFDFAYWYDLPITNVVASQLGEKKAEIASAVKAATRTSENNLKSISKKLNR